MVNRKDYGREPGALSNGWLSGLSGDCPSLQPAPRILRVHSRSDIPQPEPEYLPPGGAPEPSWAPVTPAAPKPWLTRALVGANIAVYLAMAFDGVSPTQPSTADLLRWGANQGALSLAGQAWRMLTSNYVHGGLVHIALNMWCLWNLGLLAEFIFGRWAMFLVYTLCGLAGSLASIWWHPMAVGVGASGAIFGLAGALITALQLGKLPFPRQAFQRILRSLLAFAGYNLLIGAVLPVVDNSAHIGGLLMGLALGAALGQVFQHPRDERRRLEVFIFLCGVVLLLVAGMLIRKATMETLGIDQASHAVEFRDSDGALTEQKPRGEKSFFAVAGVARKVTLE